MRLVYACHLVTVEETDRIARHRVTLLFVSGDNGVSVLNEALHLILDGGQVGADRVSPVTDLVTPAGCHFNTHVFDFSQVADAGYCSGDTGHFGKQVFGPFLIIYSFEVQTVAQHVRFETCFPSFYFFPTQIGIGQIGELVTGIDNGRLAENSRVSI